MVGPWVARWIHGSHLATGRPYFSSTAPVPMFPSAYVPQTCSPVPMFPQPVHQSLCSPFLFHRSLFHSHMFPKHVPQSLCSPVSIGLYRLGNIFRGIGNGNTYAPVILSRFGRYVWPTLLNPTFWKKSVLISAGCHVVSRYRLRCCHDIAALGGPIT